jgi:FkbM family methyltransferase
MHCASHDGFSYLTDDCAFVYSINQGKSEPYPDFIKIVEKYLDMFPNKNRTYIDVGAHLGTTIMPYSRKYNKIVGYEVNQKTFEFLTRNIKINNLEDKVTIHNYGLYSFPCTGSVFQHNSCNSGCYYFKPDPNGVIKCTTLDEDYPDNDVDYIKIDTEGSELHILQGANRILTQSKPFVQIECNNLSDKLFGISKTEIVNYMTNLGYSIFDDKTSESNIFFYHL